MLHLLVLSLLLHSNPSLHFSPQAVRSAVGDCILLSALNSSTLSVDNLKIAISKSVTSYGLTIEHETLRKAYEMVNYMRRVEVRARYNNNA